jgi:F-type H+-transporting ATPase subunit a
LFTILVGASIKYERPGKLQLMLEMVVGGFRSMLMDIMGEKKTRKLFSFLFTFFFFIIFSNWFGLLPFVGPIVIEHKEEVEHQEIIEEVEAADIDNGKQDLDVATDAEVVWDSTDDESTVLEKADKENREETENEDKEVSFGKCFKERDCILTTHGVKRIEAFPVFRAPTSDVSATMALSIIAIIAVHYMGFSSLGMGYLKKFFNLSDPMSFFVGILELVSEMGKLISFTFRLFGNIFAGEVLLLVITSITFGLATLPFMALEVFIGFIQAFVFFMLVSVFISIASEEH